MAITYKWSLGPLECIPSENGLANVVKTVRWRYTGDDGNNHISSTCGSVVLESPNPNTYIQYADLTQDVVVGWITPILNVESLSTMITLDIENQINPPFVTPPLPWNQIYK